MVENILKLIFPARCVFCNDLLPVKERINICGCCFGKINFIKGSGIIQPVDKNPDQGCCDEVYCLCEYSGIVKDALIRYKFYDKPQYFRAFAKLLADRLKKMTNYEGIDIIISVPLHKQKELSRGYNQSSLIAGVLSSELKIRDCSKLLLRTRNTGSQSLLPKDKRYMNVKDAFKVRDAVKISAKRVLLVDDILTTGNTLNECGRILKEAGAEWVAGAVIASGRKVY